MRGTCGRIKSPIKKRILLVVGGGLLIAIVVLALSSNRNDPLSELERGAVETRSVIEHGLLRRDLFFTESKESIARQVEATLGVDWSRNRGLNGNWEFHLGEGDAILVTTPDPAEDPPITARSQLTYVREQTLLEQLLFFQKNE